MLTTTEYLLAFYGGLISMAALTIAILPNIKTSIMMLLNNHLNLKMIASFSLFCGAILFQLHHQWETPTEIVVTSLSSIVLLKAISILLFPNLFSKMVPIIQHKFFNWYLMILIVLGTFMMAKAFHLIGLFQV